MTGIAATMTWVLTAAVAAAAMELWAGLIHGAGWHGPMWPMHYSHHNPTGKFEANDVLSMSHAPIAMALIIYGCEAAPGLSTNLAFGVGIGMTFFGFSYLLVHDGYVHGRLPVGWLDRFTYFRRVRAWHRVHHATDERPYGFFAPPLRWGHPSEQRAEWSQEGPAT